LCEIIKNNDIFYHWFSGGFPDAFLAPNNSLRGKWISNFVQTYIERDLPMLGLTVKTNLIRKLWTMIAHIHGNVINMSNLAKSLEISSTTIKSYLDFLEDAFLIRRLYSYSANVKKRLVKSPKIYIRDSGLLHHLLNIPNFDSLESNPTIGSSWEGYVIEQIIQRLDPDTRYYFYRTHDGAECDLVLYKGNKALKGIEIKYTSGPKLTRGLHQAFKDIGTDSNYIITPDSDDYFIHSNIRVCKLYDFLENYLNN